MAAIGQPVGKHKKIPTKYNRFREPEIRAALISNFANVTMATAALNEAENLAGGTRTINHQTVRKHLRGWVSAGDTEVTDSARQNLLDFAEQDVVESIRLKHTATSRWLLEQLGASRGYGRSGQGPGGLLVIDPANLTDQQFRTIVDPNNLTDAQMDIILEVVMSRMGPNAGMIIDAEAVAPNEVEATMPEEAQPQPPGVTDAEEADEELFE